MREFEKLAYALEFFLPGVRAIGPLRAKREDRILVELLEHPEASRRRKFVELPEEKFVLVDGPPAEVARLEFG